RPDLRFAWVMGGELEAQARALAHELGLDGRLQFLGFRPDALAVIGALDVYTLASAFEGLPFTMLEAMLLERPTVATLSGSRELIVDGVTGFGVAQGDMEGLARHILE